jgi:hypothetical protein
MRWASPPDSVPAGRSSEVVEADVEQEPQPGVDLLETRSAICRSRSVKSTERRNSAPLIARAQTCEMFCPPTRDGEHFRLEAGTAAYRAGHLTHVALVALPAPLGVGLGVPPLDERHDALETGGVGPVAAVAVAVRDVDLVVLPEEQGLLGPFGQRPPGGVERELQVVGQTGLDRTRMEVVGRAARSPTARPRPRRG